MPREHDFRFLQEIGRRLVNAREKANISQAQVAALAKITPQQLSRYELGMSDPPICTLQRIAHALRINVAALLVQVSVMAEQ